MFLNTPDDSQHRKGSVGLILPISSKNQRDILCPLPRQVTKRREGCDKPSLLGSMEV